MATRKPIKPVPTTPRKPAESAKAAGSLTSERISDDLDAFRKAGGRIEVLGNTRVLTRIDDDGKKPAG
jgi:hypothetical protein